ncbi:GNAT family N-acetyltransferase [Anaerovorax sp. IOR16]|uniref:GNAT family N-acetyltransferase n=1 Tax=Anaerovorax sp. IOR16 TaxID=2773458 RepID=UPI0019D30A4E|nr:GNAT family N-acetyltransferase [Anaerovorax sp. IOR16]
MKIINVKDRNSMLIKQLVKVWKASVKETHLFLSDLEIENIEKYVSQALAEISHLIVVENQSGVPVAFMGIDEQKLEMLFIDPKERGHGLGRKLVEYGMKEYSINELGVNEQNPQAKGFYEHMGFEVYKRTEVDENGMPYPILYMKLS